MALEKGEKQEVDKELVKKVAQLARLNITDDEAEQYGKDMEEILEAFSLISSVKTEKASFHPIETKDVLRADKKEECLEQKTALANTKHREQGFFKGPRVA